jgi:hypothetical protein
MQAGAPDSEADHTEAILWKTNAKPGWNYGFGSPGLGKAFACMLRVGVGMPSIVRSLALSSFSPKACSDTSALITAWSFGNSCGNASAAARILTGRGRFAER